MRSICWMMVLSAAILPVTAVADPCRQFYDNYLENKRRYEGAQGAHFRAAAQNMLNGYNVCKRRQQSAGGSYGSGYGGSEAQKWQAIGGAVLGAISVYQQYEAEKAEEELWRWRQQELRRLQQEEAQEAARMKELQALQRREAEREQQRRLEEIARLKAQEEAARLAEERRRQELERIARVNQARREAIVGKCSGTNPFCQGDQGGSPFGTVAANPFGHVQENPFHSAKTNPFQTAETNYPYDHFLCGQDDPVGPECQAKLWKFILDYCEGSGEGSEYSGLFCPGYYEEAERREALPAVEDLVLSEADIEAIADGETTAELVLMKRLEKSVVDRVRARLKAEEAAWE